MHSKLLFAYLRTGGGHLAPARALAATVDRIFEGRVEAVLVDGLERGAPFIRWVLEDGYRILQAKARWFYNLLYVTNKIPPVAWWNARLVAPHVTPWLLNRILHERPDRIVVVHFLLIEPIVRILRDHDIDLPVTVLVTDPYTAHPLWFRHRELDFVVFSEELRRHCVEVGIRPDRLTVFPFVLSERFSAPLPQEDVERVKGRLGFAPGRKMVLVLGGADGIPRGARLLHGLVHDVTTADLAIVCGKDRSLQRRAEGIVRRSARNDVRVYGFVDFAYELINCADIVISKCGASTFMEILLSGKIPVITDYLWEQEKGNKDFLERSRTGFYEPRLRFLPTLINRLLTDDSLYAEYRSNIRTLAVSNGAPLVSRWLVESTSRGKP